MAKAMGRDPKPLRGEHAALRGKRQASDESGEKKYGGMLVEQAEAEKDAAPQ